MSNIPLSDNDKKIKRNLRMVIAIAVLALIVLALYFMLRPVEQNTDQVMTNKDDSRAIETADNSRIMTSTLPNGKIATYSDTEGNKNISFSSSTKGSDYVALSHKGIQKFISAVDSSIVTELCGANGELAQKDGIIVGIMSTSVRSIEYPTKESCLDELATLRNTDQTSRAEAGRLIKQVTTDVRAFYSNVVIK